MNKPCFDGVCRGSKNGKLPAITVCQFAEFAKMSRQTYVMLSGNWVEVDKNKPVFHYTRQTACSHSLPVCQFAPLKGKEKAAKVSRFFSSFRGFGGAECL